MAKMGASNASAGRATMRGVRLMEAKCATIEKMAIERGFSSASAFIRAAIDHELEGAGREAKMNEAENPIAASFGTAFARPVPIEPSAAGPVRRGRYINQDVLDVRSRTTWRGQASGCRAS